MSGNIESVRVGKELRAARELTVGDVAARSGLPCRQFTSMNRKD